VKTTIEALEEAGLRDAVKVMVGGAPVTAAFAEQDRGRRLRAGCGQRRGDRPCPDSVIGDWEIGESAIGAQGSGKLRLLSTEWDTGA
jgi:hypothetical protein